jgi:hypothetical protein
MQAMIRLCTILVIAAPAGLAANLMIVVVSPFGRTIDECRMVSFKTAERQTSNQQEHKAAFSGMTGRSLPLGVYDSTIQCGDVELHKQILLTAPNQVEMVVQKDRLFISDHLKPHLTIRLRQSLPSTEAWWVRLVGLYSDANYAGQFMWPTAEASIFDPDSGSYLVVVQSSTGYVCTKEIDLAQQTRIWSFEPKECSFEVDRFAHIVEESDKRNSRTGPWYRAMQEERDKFFRSLKEATTKQSK